MQTSEQPQSQAGGAARAEQRAVHPHDAPGRRLILREALAGASILLCLSLLLGPTSRVLSSGTAHPGWLVVLILAARYGNGGLLAGTVAAAAAAVLAPLCAGAGLEPLTARASSIADLGAAVAAVLVGWVASSHHKRTQGLAVELAAAATRARDGEEAVTRLTEAAIALRSRADRTESSLAFLSDIAERIDLAGPRGAAEAALQLVIARTGAHAGLVQIADDGRLRTLASHGAWSFDSVEPPAVHRDLTAQAAMEQARPVRASDVAGARTEDSDLAAPLVGGDGHVVGMIALRGVPFPGMKTTSLSDLGVMARWLSRALTKPTDASATAIPQWHADAG